MVTFVTDDIVSIVIEIGEYSIKCGYSGDDSPIIIMPGVFGVKYENESSSKNDDNDLTRYYIGYNNITYPHKDMEIKPIFKDGTITDEKALYFLLESIIIKDLGASFSENPIILVEPYWFGVELRKKLVDYLFNMGVPALYVIKTVVASTFAHGKSSALVVDIGESSTSIVPVIDGVVINTMAVTQSLGGSTLTDYAKYLIEHDMKIPIYTRYQVASKKSDDVSNQRDFVAKDWPIGVTESWKELIVRNVVEDFKKSVINVAEDQISMEALALRHPKSYEFPDGTDISVFIQQYVLGELLFSPEKFLTDNQLVASNNKPLIGLPDLIYKVLNQLDTDLSVNLANNIILVGGTASIPNLDQRLIAELLKRCPSFKVKINSNNYQYGDSLYSAWIGASIFGSIGSFQSLWFTKQDYMDNGMEYLIKRCQL